MSTYLEIRSGGRLRSVPLAGDRMTIGKDAANDVVIEGDATVSRVHAVLERLAGRWCVRDIDSTNGTQLNGARVLGEKPLDAGDELRVGATRIVFRSDAPAATSPPTETSQRAPELTRREHEVLVALCRPVLDGDMFTEPASIRDIAAALFVTEAAVKQHLGRLYDKFEIADDGERRRVRLANEALNRGAVKLSDLEGKGP